MNDETSTLDGNRAGVDLPVALVRHKRDAQQSIHVATSTRPSLHLVLNHASLSSAPPCLSLSLNHELDQNSGALIQECQRTALIQHGKDSTLLSQARPSRQLYQARPYKHIFRQLCALMLVGIATCRRVFA
jgi:hypothetical protein